MHLVFFNNFSQSPKSFINEISKEYHLGLHVRVLRNHKQIELLRAFVF